MSHWKKLMVFCFDSFLLKIVLILNNAPSIPRFGCCIYSNVLSRWSYHYLHIPFGFDVGTRAQLMGLQCEEAVLHLSFGCDFNNIPNWLACFRMIQIVRLPCLRVLHFPALANCNHKLLMRSNWQLCSVCFGKGLLFCCRWLISSSFPTSLEVSFLLSIH